MGTFESGLFREISVKSGNVVPCTSAINCKDAWRVLGVHSFDLLGELLLRYMLRVTVL